MRVPDWLKLAAGLPDRTLENGVRLRLLTAREILEARREAAELAKDGKELALCSNACLVARAVLGHTGRRRYRDGGEVLDRLTPGEIEALARCWARFRKEEAPGLELGRERLDELKASLERLPGQRLRWRVLRLFGALPTEKRARDMTDGDYLWCAVNLLLDEEEEAALLCPRCREEARKDRCPVCGREKGQVIREENGSFDWERFRTLRDGQSPGGEAET